MAQFDVYRTREGEVPFVVDVQHPLLDVLATGLVIPPCPADDVPKPMSHLNPVFEVDGTRVVLMTPELVGVPVTVLGVAVGSLAHERDRILAAGDFLLTGV